MSTTATRVYVACQPISRRGLEDLLASAGLRVVAISNGEHDVVPEVLRSGAELALLDVGRPGVEVDRVMESLGQRDPAVRVVFASHARVSPPLLGTIESGAAGLLALESALDELRMDLERIADGMAVVSARFELPVRNALRERGGRADDRALSPRQATILELIADDVSTKGIAELLSISPLTVRTHYAGIHEKLDVSTQAAAVAAAFRRGLLS